MLILVLLCLFTRFTYTADAAVPAVAAIAVQSISEPSSERVDKRQRLNQFHKKVIEDAHYKRDIINNHPDLIYEPYQNRSLLAYFLDEWCAAKYTEHSHYTYLSDRQRSAIETIIKHGARNLEKFKPSIKDACNFFAAHESEMNSRHRFYENFRDLESIFTSRGIIVRPAKTKRGILKTDDVVEDVAEVRNNNEADLDLVDRFFIKVNYRHYGQAIELINQYPWLLNKCDDKGQSALTSAMVSWGETDVMTAKRERKLFILFVLSKGANIDIKGTNYFYHNFSSSWGQPGLGVSASDLMRRYEYHDIQVWHGRGADWCRQEYEKLKAELQPKTPPTDAKKQADEQGKQPEASKSFLSSMTFKCGVATLFLAGVVYYFKFYKKKEINTDFIEDEPEK